MKVLLYREITLALLLATGGCAGKLGEDQDFYRVVRDAGSPEAGKGGAAATSASQVGGPALSTTKGSAGGKGGSVAAGGKGGAGGAGGSAVAAGGAGGAGGDVFNDDDMVVGAGGAGGRAAVGVAGGAGGRAAVGGAGGAGGRAAVGGAGGGNAGATAACDFRALIETKCGNATCHGAPASSTGLDLTSAMLAMRVQGRKGQGACSDKLLVDPANPAESKLYLKVAGSSCGAQMPLGGMLTEPEQECVLTWIENL